MVGHMKYFTDAPSAAGKGKALAFYVRHCGIDLYATSIVFTRRFQISSASVESS
jgi:hypothetical protein